MGHAHDIVGLRDIHSVFERHGDAKKQVTDAFQYGKSAQSSKWCFECHAWSYLINRERKLHHEKWTYQWTAKKRKASMKASEAVTLLNSYWYSFDAPKEAIEGSVFTNSLAASRSGGT